MWLIVGLGNPGQQYEWTRHNAGFLVVDQMQQELAGSAWKTMAKHQVEISSAKIDKDKVILAKPLTYMNESGQAVQSLMKYYKIKPSQVIVVFDDVDLPYGVMRLKQTGSAGTHNGVKSIVKHIGKDFNRVKIGIKPKRDIKDLANFVLKNFSKAELSQWSDISGLAMTAMTTMVSEGVDTAMNMYNKKA